ncbi:uncharacterized protein LOC131956005 isoform X2 [Physella acuta]|uniref:uncharacterized protein LOC131956005 isoform X2 n=1 Tax=Physella acuta TaxID=109671 RepID=UPI0027DAE7C1|nr:uncharacterized protein LOC131956005 isoform X2 [Physella acuta]
MSVNFHVPDCEEDSCAENLHSLVEKLRKKHVTVVENKLSGCFKEIFVEQFETCSFTILHKCEQFWIKLKLNGLDVYSKEHADKIMCVKLKNSSSLYATPMNGEETADCFFQHFNVKSVINEKNLQIFVETVLSSIPDVGRQEEVKKKKPILPQRHKPVSREVSQADVRHVNLYDNAPVEEKVILEKLESLRCCEDKKSNESDHRLMPYPEVQGKNKESNVYARVINKAEHAQFIISYSSIRSFAELKDKIKELRKCPEKFPANINFLIHKVLPELYHSNSILGLVHIAVCCDYPLLQRRSFDHIELLILKGQIKNSHVDLDTLQYMQTMLAKSIHDLSLTKRADIHTESAITRSCNIIIMLQIEIMMNFNETDDVNESEEFLSDMRSTLKTCKSLKNTEKYITTLQKVLESPLESIHHEVHNYFSENGTQDLSNRANYILGKSLAFQFAAILDCLKKLFLKIDVAVLDLLLECFRPKKWLLKKTFAPAVSSMLLRGLTHFLFYGLREIPHINIHNPCHKVMAVIDNLSKQNLPSEISILNSLMFETTPVIRQCTIDFFDKNKCYDSWLNVYLLREVEHKLAPLLEVDQEAKTALKDDNLNEEWLSLTGNFCNLPAVICIHRPSKESHKSGHIINFNDKTRSSHRTHFNQIELLQHLDHCNIVKLLSFHIESIPQFYILETRSSLQDYLINKNINQQYCTYVQLVEFLRQAASALFYCHNMDVIHANITAASFLISSTGDTVKLSGFLFAVTNDNDTLSSDSRLLPSRWCAPETLRRLKVSEMSDSWMFGHLMYEILTHGVLPYSHVQLDDETCVKKICNKKIKLYRESCINPCHYEVIEKCISHDPHMRPTMQDVHAFFEWKNIKASHQATYPNYHSGNRAPSRDFKLGVIYLEDYIDIIQPKILQRKLSETLSLNKVGEVAVVTEVTDRLFPEEIMTKLNLGILDFILPRIYATVTQDKKQCIEIFLPPSCHESLMQLLLSPDFDSSEENCIRLMLNVAEMLQKFHELSFVLGDMCASYLFVRKQKGKLTLHPISLSKLNTIDESSSKLNKVHFDELVLRRTAPEVMRDNMATVTPQSDVFSFGCLMWEILELSCCLKESGSLRSERTYVSMSEILSNEININDVKQLRCDHKPIFSLIQRCLHDQPKERPNFKEIIRVLSEKLNPDHTDLKVLVGEQSSGTSAVEHETMVKQVPGTSSEQNDQTKNKKKKVKIPFLSKRLSKSSVAVKPNDYEIDNKEDETQPKQIYVSNHNTDVTESKKDFIYRPKEIQSRRLNLNLYHGAIQTRPLPKVPESNKLQHESKQFNSNKPSVLIGSKNIFQNKDDQKKSEVDVSVVRVSFSMDSSDDETRSEDDELCCQGPSHHQKSSVYLPNIPLSDKVYHAKPINFQANYVLADFISPVDDPPNPLPHMANTTRLGYNNLTQQTLASNNVSRYIYKTVEKLDPEMAPDFEQFYQVRSSSETLKTSDLLLDYGCAWRPLPADYPYLTSSYSYNPFDKTRLFPSCDYIQPLSPMDAEEDDFIPVIMHQKYVGREKSTYPIAVEESSTRQIQSGENSACQIGIGENSTCPIGIGENSACQKGIGENSTCPIGIEENSACQISVEENSTCPIGIGENFTCQISVEENSTCPIGIGENFTCQISVGENSKCQIGVKDNSVCQVGPYDDDQSIHQHCKPKDMMVVDCKDERNDLRRDNELKKMQLYECEFSF